MTRTANRLTGDTLLESLWENKGTDLLLTTGLSPMVRVDGEVGPLEGYGRLSLDTADALLGELMTPAQQTSSDAGEEVGFSFTWRATARLRGSALRAERATQEPAGRFGRRR